MESAAIEKVPEKQWLACIIHDAFSIFERARLAAVP